VRERTIAGLKDGRIDILVATDVAARGLDGERISHVPNYDLPPATESHVHRSRATGPAGGFVPFAGAANIPVGSQLDTKKGRVALTSAADTGAVKTQTSDFYQGIFQVKQSVRKSAALERASRYSGK